MNVFEILSEAKQFKMVGDMEFTLDMIAEYYNTPPETIRTKVKRMKKTMEFYGEVRKLDREKLANFKNEFTVLNLKMINALLLVNLDGVLRIGLTLSESDIANKIQSNSKGMLLPDKYNDTVISNFKFKENKLKNILLSTFNNYFTIDYQVRCGKYFIDFVINENIAVECDEYGHSQYNSRKEIDREKYIVSQGYKILRYNPDGEDSIFELINRILNTYKIA